MMDAVYRAESRRVLTTRIRLLDISNSQRRRGTKPSVRRSHSGRARRSARWLISTGHFKAIDAMPVVPGSTLLKDTLALIGHRFQNPCDGMRNARLKREDAFSHAMIIVNSAMVSSS